VEDRPPQFNNLLYNVLKKELIMSGIYMLIPTLLVVFVSYLIVRAGGIALRMTGMDEERARLKIRGNMIAPISSLS